MTQPVRLAVAAAVVWYAFGMPGLPAGGGGVAPVAYTGPLAGVHSAAASMDAHDRQGLAEALAAAGVMLRDDRAGLIKTTADAQTFTRGTLAYGYTSFSVSKYPAVAAAVQAELEKATGDTVAEMTPDVRARMAATLEELSQAVR